MLKFNQLQKSDKAKFIMYADLECTIEKIVGHKNNPENLPTIKLSELTPSGFSISTILSFRSIETKHYVYRAMNCMKKFCKFLREHAMKAISFKKRKMILLTKERQQSYENVKNLLYL